MDSHSTWEAREQDLHRHVDYAQGISVAFVKGPPGSGKSTTMLSSLARRFDEFHHHSASIMHIAPGEAKQALVRDFLGRSSLTGNTGREDPMDKIIMETVQSFCAARAKLARDRKSAHNMFPSQSTIIFWNLDVLPSYFEELGLTTLMQGLLAASQISPPQRVAIFLLASHESQRTMELFRRGGWITENIDFHSSGPLPDWRFQAESRMGRVSWRPREAVQDQVIARGAQNCAVPFEPGSGESYHGRRIERVGLSFEAESLCSFTKSRDKNIEEFELDHALSWSAPIDGLATIFSPSRVLDTVYRHGQLILAERPITRPELQVLHSWASRTISEFGTKVEIVASYTREDMGNFSDDGDSVGSAWNIDLLFTVLWQHDHWGSNWVGDMVMRRPVGSQVWTRSTNLLIGQECLMRDRGTTNTTPLGASVNAMRQNGVSRRWHSALLLSKALSLHGHVLVSRVLCVLAVVVEEVLIPSFIAMDYSDSVRHWPNWAARKDMCRGPLINQVFAGSLWYNGGLWMRMASESTKDLERGNKPRHSHLGHGVTVNMDDWHRSRLLYDQWLPLCSQPDNQPAWKDFQGMTAAELEQIQTILAEVFMFQFLRFEEAAKQNLSGCEEFGWDCNATDCQSGQRVAVTCPAMDWKRIWAANPEGFYAFYTAPLRRRRYGLTASEATYIPVSILVKMAEKRGHVWPVMVQREHWVMST